MSPNSDHPGRSAVDFEQEVRFAVVMYGGSSLAIYINGVAQELLRLVRATAPGAGGAVGVGPTHLADEELRGSERVYRRLGRLLGRQRVHPEDDGEGAPSPLRTRFVIDILTGSSAGGINAIYLAKALANDQDIDELKKLWVSEGDIAVLLNDRESYEGLKFRLEDDEGEPWSVLNSRRMYLKLLEALRGMDGKPACAPGRSPLVDELDLFVTATDVTGRALQMRLADGVVSEYRHRNVFRFRYRSQRASDIDHSDFGPTHNAFLAFAARATSAHQAAFSPVSLDDVARIVAGNYEAEGEYPAAHEALRAFYTDYLLQCAEGPAGAGETPDPAAKARAFRNVWFVDGGTLDNKPFSFVAEQLPQRHADTSVDRKLLYVEPSPEHMKRVKSQEQRPRIVGNVLAALSSLPRYETIVEDLTRLLERNRLVERLEHIMRGMEKDLSYGMRPQGSRTGDQLREMLGDRGKTREWMMSKGASWGGYQRLRVAEVTDDMTLLVARAAGFSEESDEFLSIRSLVRAWRAANYDPHMEEGKRPEVEFLLDFDLLWAMRRVSFVIRKLNALACLDEHAKEIAGAARGERESPAWPEAAEQAEFDDAVRRVRRGLNEALVGLRGERRRLWSRDGSNPFRPAIAALEVDSSQLLELLREPTDADRRARAEQLLKAELVNAPPREPPLRTRGDAVEALTRAVRSELARAVEEAGTKCEEALLPPEGGAAADAPRWEAFLRRTLWYYYVHFEEFDQIAYPILYSTGVGEEADVIDVFRVSPEDATALVDESQRVDARGRKVSEGAPGRLVQKLAGTTLGNFGAFFEPKFRVNDIMWGRLDGAERVIAALLPEDRGLRERMTEQAHRAILIDEVLSADEGAAADEALQRSIWDACDVWHDEGRRRRLLGEAAERLPPGSSARVYLEKLESGAEPRDLFREAFYQNYDEGRRFGEETSVRAATRANRVLNDMALAYAPADGKGGIGRRVLFWLGRRLRDVVESLIVPKGAARRKQRRKMVAAYLGSLLILVLVCTPAFMMMLSAGWTWRALFFFITFLVTALLAILPMLVTGGYIILFRWLSGVADARLRGGSGH